MVLPPGLSFFSEADSSEAGCEREMKKRAEYTIERSARGPSELKTRKRTKHSAVVSAIVSAQRLDKMMGMYAWS